MNESNRELLEQVVEKRLTDVLESDLGTDEAKLAFKEAMEAIDREINLRKLDDSYYSESENRSLEKEKIENYLKEKTALMEFEEKKLELSNDEQVARRKLDEKKQNNDEEYRKKESNRAFWIGIGTIAGTIIAPIAGFYTKKAFAKMICTFEKDYTFTTSPGRSLGGLFRFKD